MDNIKSKMSFPWFLHELKEAVTSVVIGKVTNEIYIKSKYKMTIKTLYAVDYSINICVESFDDIGNIDEAIQKWADTQGGNIYMVEEKRENDSYINGKIYDVTYSFRILVAEKLYNQLPDDISGCGDDPQKAVHAAIDAAKAFLSQPPKNKDTILNRRLKIVSVKNES